MFTRFKLMALTLGLALTGCSSDSNALDSPAAAKVTTPVTNIVGSNPAPIAPVQKPMVTAMIGELHTESRWQRSDGAKVTLVLTNQTDKTLNYTIRSGMLADFILTQGAQVKWRYSQDMMFTQMLSQMTLAPLAERKVTVMVASSSLQGLATGRYQLSAQLNALEQDAVRIRPVTIELQ